jgi:hypothetical protein
LFGFNTDAPFPIIFGVLGFVAGVMFSGILMLTEGRRGFDQLRISRFAVWGAVGGFLLSGVLTRLASLGWADAFAIAPTFSLSLFACLAAVPPQALSSHPHSLDEGTGRNWLCPMRRFYLLCPQIRIGGRGKGRGSAPELLSYAANFILKGVR